jgi:hypothetical protein
MRVMDGVEGAAIDSDLLQSPTLNRSTRNIQGRVNWLLEIWRRPSAARFASHSGTARGRSNSNRIRIAWNGIRVLQVEYWTSTINLCRQ